MSQTAKTLNAVIAKSAQKDLKRRKRLGQYFTGKRLARLLVAIADGWQCQSAIDPMCGSGDMLAAVLDVAPEAKLTGIEIDAAAYDQCSDRFANFRNPPDLFHGNAFSWQTISQLGSSKFDLVITNPPYVRYQSLSAENQESELPSARAVRKDLLNLAKELKHLDENARKIFISIINGYSGLSDLAVPSWILCAMLTSVGARLAMVVPDQWLNREYAYIVHYLLLKLFRISWVVEDENRAWFEEAQIKTTLLVAERIQPNDDVRNACSGKEYLQVAIPASVITNKSVVGGLFSDRSEPEKAFAQELSHLEADPSARSHEDLSVTRRALGSKLSDLIARASHTVWFAKCEPSLVNKESQRPRVPQALIDLFPVVGNVALTTLDALGVSVGQGLRTGANEFFYCDLISESEDACLVAPGKALRLDAVSIPREALRVALRKQSELPEGYVVLPSSLRGRLLVLDRFVHPDDLESGTTELFLEPTGRSVMAPALAAMVSAAEKTNLGTKEHPKFIPQMSAVRTNEWKSKSDRSNARYWYMLPKLARRHVPDMLIARVNHSHPKVVMNSSEKTIIDANFSTIWLHPTSRVDQYGLLACLNSSWASAAMELSAAILGGGALKLEAAHLRSLPIPELSANDWGKLSRLGVQLCAVMDHAETLAQINQCVAQALFGPEKADSVLQTFEAIKSDKLRARSQK